MSLYKDFHSISFSTRFSHALKRNEDYVEHGDANLQKTMQNENLK